MRGIVLIFGAFLPWMLSTAKADACGSGQLCYQSAGGCPNCLFGTCQDCGCGYYNPSGCTTACTPCPPGQVSNTGQRSTSCVPCTAGTYCPNSNTCPGNGIGCKAGTYCPAGSAQPTVCPAGSYCPTSNAISATPCNVGYYCPTSGLSAQIPCPMSNFCPTTGLTSFVICEAGYICPSGLLSQETLCPPMYYCPQSGMSAGQLCSPGYFCPGGTIAQISCLAGYYCPTAGLSAQVLCTVGNYCPPLASAPTACPIGTYCPATGLSGAIPCPIGYYCSGVGLTAATACPSGQTTTSVGSSSASACVTQLAPPTISPVLAPGKTIQSGFSCAIHAPISPNNGIDTTCLANLCVPGLTSFIGMGYNIIKANLFEEPGAPSIKSRIFDFASLQSSSMVAPVSGIPYQAPPPSSLQLTPSASQKAVSTGSESSSFKSYADDFSASFQTTIPVPSKYQEAVGEKVGVGGSVGLNVQSAIGSSSYFVESMQSIETATMMIAPATQSCSTFISTQLANLAGASSNAFDSFIANYGTHVITGVQLGGYVDTTTTVKSSSVSCSSATNLGGSFSTDMFSFTVSSQKSSTTFQSQSITRSTQVVCGGAPQIYFSYATSAYQQASSNPWQGWLTSVTNTQSPRMCALSLTLTPIYEIAPTGAIQSGLQTALTKYLQNAPPPSTTASLSCPTNSAATRFASSALVSAVVIALTFVLPERVCRME